MRRRPVLALTAVLLFASAGAASAADDTVLSTSTAGTLSMTGGTIPTTSLSTAIGATTETVGSVMTIADLRGQALGWNVTAKYIAPPANVILDGATTATSITALPASAVKVKVPSATAATTTTSGAISYNGTFQTLDATNAVTVAAATAATSGGTTTFTPSYSVTLPTNATLGTLYGATISYTVSPL